MIKCPKCNQELQEGANFCYVCGASIATAETAPEKVAPINEEEDIPASIQEDETTNKKKKRFFFLGGIVATVLVVVLVLSMVLAGASQSSYAIYIKDKELFYTQAAKWKPWQITKEFDESHSFDNEGLSDISYILGMYVALSQDGKTIFYVDKIDDSDGLSIYYRKVNSKKEPKKIASEVRRFEVNDKGNIVTYLRSEDNNLYQHNLKDKEKIAIEVEDFVVSDDGKTIVYQNEDNDLYIYKSGKGKKKIASEVDYLKYVSEDLETVYYLKDDTLYKKQQGKDKVKIASNVQSVINVYDSGEIYYLKAESDEVKLSAYVIDDMKETDEAMVAPEYPDSYNSDAEYEAAYNQYEKERDAYYDKMDRDNLREELEEETMDTVTYKLCYYNSKKEVVITEHATDWETFAEDKAAVVYASTEKAEVTKVKLSEIDSIYDVEDMIEKELESATEYYLAVGNETSMIKQDEARHLHMDAAGETIYMIDKVSEGGDVGELYKIKISGKKAGTPKKIDENVYIRNASLIQDSYIYYKDVNDDGDSGDLYINGENVDSDVSLGSVSYQDGNYAYMVEWDEDDECGTLRKYNGKKPITLSDEVYNFVLLQNGEILYLYDYNREKYRGELYLCTGNKPKKIDEDVVSIIRVYDNNR